MTDPRRILTHIGLCCVMVAGICRDASACLRAAPDERAIQWSSAIVEAKLKVIGEPVELARVGEAEFGKPRLVHAYWYRLYTFDVTEVLDGRRVRRGRDVKVVRFFGRIDRGGPQARPCARHLGEEDVGRPFILLLRPERDLSMEVAPIDPALNDVRTEALRGLDAYAIVSLVPRAEMDPDEKAALKRRIDDVRRAERAFSVERARRAAERIIAAGDTFEAEDDAEELLAMGPRAVPVMVRVSSDRRGPRVGRDRLQVLIAQLTPPPIPVTIEGPTAVDHDEPG